MARIISPRTRVECVSYAHSFTWRGDPGAGFRFPCDAQGVLQPMTQAAQENYADCISGNLDVRDDGIVVSRWSYWQDAMLQCDCGEQVQLDHFTNTCPRCHADYNRGGQLLGPRDQWGEETGESLDDILRIP